MRQQIFFTLYNDFRYQQHSFVEAEARVIDEFCPELGKTINIPHQTVRLEIEDDGDIPEIKSAGFVTAESLKHEAESAGSVLDSMRDGRKEE